MTGKKVFNPLDAIFTPSQVASATMRDVEHTIATARYGVKLGLPGLDGYWAPMLPGKTYTLIGQTSHGKCLAPGTQILMYNGEVKPVEEIEIGDCLMGPDSMPRRVISTTTGIDEMYRVTPSKGDAYIVNEAHILALEIHGAKSRHRKGDPENGFVEIPVHDYLKKSDRWKHLAKGYRVGVDWPYQQVPLEPYFLGVWLGDGHTIAPSITNIDMEVISYLHDFAANHDMTVKVYNKKGAPTHSITTDYKSGRPGGNNHVINSLKSLGLINSNRRGYKYGIPMEYKVNSREIRLELLAGLIDTDGSYQLGEYDITQKNKGLAEDIAFVARSLGFAAYIKECQKTCTNNGVTGIYHRVIISGDLDQIPCKIARKKATPRRKTSSVLRTGISVESIGPGRYYGFELDGPDGLFLLGDFTVTHNTMLIDYIEHYNASMVKARNKARAEGAQPEIVVHVSVEDLIEEQGVRELGRFSGEDSNEISLGKIVNLDLLRSAASQIADKPIYRIGESLAHPDMMQYLTVSNMLRCLDAIVDGTLVPGFMPQITLLVFDYLQAFPLDPESMREKFEQQRRLQVRNDMYRLRQAAARYHCPVFVAVQAKQKLDGVVLPLHLPGLYDGEESSSIAQRADGSLSINMPKHNHPVGRNLEVEGAFNFKVAENQMAIRVLKQRGRLPSGRIFLAEVNYADYSMEITKNRWTA